MNKIKIAIIILLISISLVSNAYGKEDLSDKMLVRIDIDKIEDVEQLQQIGLFPIVEETNYVDGLIDKSKDKELKKLGYSFKHIKGDNLVQRIIEISINDKNDVNELAALGLDIWEVNDENIIAMAFDNDIHTIKKKGYKVKILYKSGKKYLDDITSKQKNAKVMSISSESVSIQASTPQYHSYDSLRSDLDTLQNNYPNIAKVVDIGNSWESRDILALKISDDVNTDDSSEPDILFMGNHHAREWISVEVPYYIGKYLLEHYSTDSEIKQLVDDNEIWVIPMVNPDGHEYSRTHDRLWRKNRMDFGLGIYGVDLNRNYGYQWGCCGGSSGSPWPDLSGIYRGPDAFSELETQAIRNLIQSPNHEFVKSLSYHSYSQLVLYPWGYTRNAPLHEFQLYNMAVRMASEINAVGVEHTAKQSSHLYITDGSSDDWLYNEKNMAAFTIELRPSDSNVGFILPETQIIPSFEENLPAALYLMKWSQKLDIISPTSSLPVKVTDTINPIEVIVEVRDIDDPISLYTNNDFTIKVGGLETNHILESSLDGRYKFKVYPPTELFPSTWKLEVEVKCAGCESKDIEESSIQYPDDFGYTYRDSRNLGLCGLDSVACDHEYDWIEISGTGTEVLPNSDDSVTESIDLGFFFNFYGTDYSQLAIANNGLLFSAGTTWQYRNDPITRSPGVHGFIAPLWDDIITYDSRGAGTIYYETRDDENGNKMFIVEWYDNKHYGNSDYGVTFEAILYEGSNNIKFQYKDVDFGNVYGATSGDNPPYNNGGSATVGIEGPTGDVGLEYSYNQPVIDPDLAILFKYPQFAGTNMYLSNQAPASKDHGSMMTYTLHYHNFGDTEAQDVMIEDTLPQEVEFISASDIFSYDSTTRKVTWDIGTVVPSGHNYRTVTVRINDNIPVGYFIHNNARIDTSTLEVREDDNDAQAQTRVTGSTLPPDVGVEPNNGGTGTPSVSWNTPITFTYYSECATNIDISIQPSSGSAITESMTGGPPDWSYTTSFSTPGEATVTYTITGCSQSVVSFNIYIDPAGYIFDIDTGERIEGATVWLQWSDGEGGWVPVPVIEPAYMIPNINPQISNETGWYQWDVVEGSYRVHVEAAGYYPADSIVVSIPPAVTNLHVGLTRIPSESNQPPVATDDTVTTDEDMPVTFNVTINDSDADGNLDPSSAINLSNPSHGNIVNDGDGTFIYTPAAEYDSTDSFTYEICDTDGLCDTATVTINVNPVNDPPVASVDRTEQTVQYSDGISTVTISASDVDSPLTLTTSWKMNDGAEQTGLPNDLTLSSGSCTTTGPSTACTWTLEGNANVIADNYNITFNVSDGQYGIIKHTNLIVISEDSMIAFDDSNPVAVKVAAPGGESEAFSLKVNIKEVIPDISDALALSGDINLAEVSISLVPVGPGPSVNPASCSRTVAGTGYDATLTLNCGFNDVNVNTYEVMVTVNGGYYIGSGENVLVVYDPSLGFTTGGGTFLWPETGEKTNFGYNMKYNKKGAKVQGSLLLVRHLSDGTIYRVKSNALYGLSIGEDDTYGWASFSGKATYREPEWLEPVGNHEFIVYVEDRNEPGNGADRFWIKVKGQDGKPIDAMSLNDPSVDNTISLSGGNIVVPHK